MTDLFQAIAVFSYANLPETTDALRLVHDTVRAQTRIIENNQPLAQGLTEIWEEFLPDYLHEVAAFSQNFAMDGLDMIEAIWNRDGRNNPLFRDVLETIRLLREEKDNMKFPDLG